MATSRVKITITDQIWSQLESQQNPSTIFLDPISLYKKLDWTDIPEKVDTLNQLYNWVFDEVIVAQKSLHVYWPIGVKTSEPWFQLLQLSKNEKIDFALKPSVSFTSERNELHPEIVQQWQELILILLQSLLEDLTINSQFEEIGTLTFGKESIFLFKTSTDGGNYYGFAEMNSPIETSEVVYSGVELFSFEDIDVYESFEEMVLALLRIKDIEVYNSSFMDKSLEKQYFTLLLNQENSFNLILRWLDTYSLN